LLEANVDVGELVELKMALVVGQQGQQQNRQGWDVVKKYIPWVLASLFEFV
jgi:hypothetical protein